MTKVSVIMGVYNGERFVREAIESVLAQTYTNFEFLIVDDCSRDQSAEILVEYAARDPRIKIITNEKNCGLTKSLNNALSLAQGEYCARIDADDRALPERLAKQVAFLDAHDEVVLIGCGIREINEQGSVVSERVFPSSHDELVRALIRYNPFVHAAVMFRTNTARAIGGYDESYYRSQDYDMWLRLASQGRIANVADILVDKRYSSGMISIKGEQQQLSNALRARAAAIKRGQYPWFTWIFLIRPAVVLMIPTNLRRWLRQTFTKTNLYG